MEPRCRRFAATPSSGRGWSCWVALALLPAATVVATKFECKDASSCEARMASLVDRLGANKNEMQDQKLTLTALEDLRAGILTGKRVELPSAQRQHLQKASPIIGEVSFDARHRPVSTNVSRHFKSMRTIGPDVEVKLFAFMPLKKGGTKAAPAVTVVISEDSKLWIFDFDGVALLEGFDLEHGYPIARMSLSQSQDSSPFIVTVDTSGKIRVHSIKIAPKKEKKGDKDLDDEEREAKKKQLAVFANFSSEFVLPRGDAGEPRGLTAVLPVERGSTTYFVTADSLGGIGVFFKNGTMKGRVKVTEDFGGVRGLMRSTGQMILYHSSHSFGYFSATQIDVQYPPCTGWSSPIYDVVADPASSSNRVILGLTDGDVIVFSTSQGKSKTCDLTLKFPHVSALPLKLHAFRGHIMGLPMLTPDTPQEGDYLRDVIFFNLAATDHGYGSSPSRALALQASFKPKQPAALALATGSSPGDRTKSHVAIRFEGQKGLELYELSLKQPAAAKAVGGDGAAEGGLASWLDWFPKIGVFGVALVGVAIWNVRKATSQNRQSSASNSSSSMYDLDEHLAELRSRRQAKKDTGGDGGGLRERSRMPDLGGDDED